LYDTTQMLALPELDVLDALECDIVHVTLAELTNAFDEPERWKRYDHNGRLPALVRDPECYRLLADGCIVQRAGGVDTFMPSGSTVFDADHMVRQIETLLPEIKDFIDVIMFAADDQGTQYGPLLPPSLFREVFVPSCRRMSDAIHREAPGVKVFLHSCGAIFELIPAIIDAGFDVLNPVQWSAGRHSYREWEETAGGKISLWGSGYVVRPSSKGYGAEE
jgi:hypothetical protein